MEARGGLDELGVRQLRRETKEQYASLIACLLDSDVEDGITPQIHLPRNDSAATVIVELAKKQSIDLLVMGTVCRTGLPGFFIGNTAEKVLSEVNCSVLTVKPEGFVTPVTLE